MSGKKQKILRKAVRDRNLQDITMSTDRNILFNPKKRYNRFIKKRYMESDVCTKSLVQ